MNRRSRLWFVVDVAYYTVTPFTVVYNVVRGDALSAAVFALTLGAFAMRDAGRLGRWMNKRALTTATPSPPSSKDAA
jgi:hypothetical protein